MRINDGLLICRLCSEEGVAKFILERGGIHRLVSLSRNEKERNYSDGVLIAALVRPVQIHCQFMLSGCE